mgnify:FL=1
MSDPATDCEKKQRPSPRYVFVERPRCPACGGVRLRAYGTVTQSDSSKMQYSQCKTCGEKFRIIFE